MKTKRVSTPHDYSMCSRKIQRSVLRHTADKSKDKSIKVFHYLWKQLRSKKGYIAVDGGKQIEKKSLLQSKFGQLLKGGK